MTRHGRGMYAQGSMMGIAAREQPSDFSDDGIAAVHRFPQSGWTAERAAHEQAKIALFPPPMFKKNGRDLPAERQRGSGVIPILAACIPNRPMFATR